MAKKIITQESTNMALKEDNAGNGKRTYLTVVGGKFCQRVDENTEGAVPRELTMGKNKGKTVFEKFYKEITGYITGGNLETGEFGESIMIHVSDPKEESEVYLRLPWNSKLRDAFVKRLPNLDVNKPVELVCFPDKENGSPVLLIKQNNENLPFYYKKGEMNGLPEPTEKTIKGKRVLNWDDVEAFLWGKAEEFFEQFEGDEPPVGQESGDSEEEEETSEEEVEDDKNSDIPF
jgi:hypothetical protein